ncbi:putative hydrolase/acyltransferase [Tanacetum coccineum]
MTISMSVFAAYNQQLLTPCRPPRKILGLKCEVGRLSVKAAASSSFTGSGAQYSEPLPAAQKKKKGRTIVGIDQDELVDPTLLADPDSCFCEFQGLQLHHKICDPESEADSDSSQVKEKLKFPLILLHGFGASLFSWNEVMKRLAKVAGSKVLSFDRPAFGLTTREYGNMVDSPVLRRCICFLSFAYLLLMLVRMVIDKFGIASIKNAWYDASQVTDSILETYTRPLRTKGWDRALLEFTAEMVASSVPESNPSLTERLNEISCPAVLIVTGDSDRLVPSWNSVRLSQAIPGSRLEIIKKCGHLPQEEKPQELVAIVDNFLTNVFNRTESQPLQAAI